jgi:CRISPR-associated endonuclease/helicase Cas3
VTEMTTISAVRQRFGRLNRLGVQDVAHAVILCPGDAAKAVVGAYKWLRAQADTKKGKKRKAEIVLNMCSRAFDDVEVPVEDAPASSPLTATDLAALAQTTVPADVDVDPWITGYTDDKDEVSILWRKDLPDSEDMDEYLSALPPIADEVMTVPRYVVRKWLARLPADQVRSKGNLYLVDAAAGGHDDMSFAPDSQISVSDVAETETRKRLSQADADAYRAGKVNLTDLSSAYGLDGYVVIAPFGKVYAIKSKEDAIDYGAGDGVTLSNHSKAVGKYSRAFSARLASMQEMLHLAGIQHDIGKSIDAVQIWFGQDDNGKPLAKSARRSFSDAMRARKLSGLQPGYRHEMESLAMLEDRTDLIAYLVAAHHGHCRAMLPALPDAELWERCGGSDWPIVYQSMSDKYGHYGLAYLEAVLRLADHMVSRKEVGCDRVDGFAGK